MKNNYIYDLKVNFYYTWMENFLISKKPHSDIMDFQFL